MKKLIIILLFSMGAWKYYSNNYSNVTPVDIIQYEIIEPIQSHTLENDSFRYSLEEENFKCDGRQYCSQMNSLAEANYFIRNCPNTKMDGDNDGRPCENDTRFH
ncbi:excalibur calcium-binding domain-containing protein [Pseudoalteromonas sp. MEBiC 03607]|uniref:excalibur calcium-binding domain-containing protein n=1 Tax=Pseudoalteromonas sp. MEBiC 03607 TaxID=2563601 RepID=UPI001F0EC9C5|nr:excalibur calcium-binding domain-containing protein [Pseudoalteromonas sp. MEBiC 03607]